LGRGGWQDAAVPESLDALVALLDLEQIEVNLFRGRQPDTALQRVFGGQVAAQALVAAGRTVDDDLFVHSLHAYFILPGDTAVPIVYDVERVRDGRSFGTRRVVARQHGRSIFYASTSFHRREEGFDHQDVMPSTPVPEACPRLGDLYERVTGRSAAEWEREWAAIDVRYAGNSRPGGEIDDPAHPAAARLWLRTAGALSDDPELHSCVLTYASDLTLLGATLVPHGKVLGTPDVQTASIDHAMWFHRPFRADEWLLYDQLSPSASGGRGLAIGRVFTADGTLAVTVAQEGLIRPVAR
jgi:acyl-CoA thioesterase-2